MVDDAYRHQQVALLSASAFCLFGYAYVFHLEKKRYDGDPPHTLQWALRRLGMAATIANSVNSVDNTSNLGTYSLCTTYFTSAVVVYIGIMITAAVAFFLLLSSYGSIRNITPPKSIRNNFIILFCVLIPISFGLIGATCLVSPQIYVGHVITVILAMFSVLIAAFRSHNRLVDLISRHVNSSRLYVFNNILLQRSMRRMKIWIYTMSSIILVLCVRAVLRTIELIEDREESDHPYGHPDKYDFWESGLFAWLTTVCIVFLLIFTYLGTRPISDQVLEEGRRLEELHRRKSIQAHVNTKAGGQQTTDKTNREKGSLEPSSSDPNFTVSVSTLATPNGKSLDQSASAPLDDSSMTSPRSGYPTATLSPRSQGVENSIPEENSSESHSSSMKPDNRV